MSIRTGNRSLAQRLAPGSHRWIAAASLSAWLLLGHAAGAVAAPQVLPTSQTITPTAARGSMFSPLNPNLAANPNYVVGQAVSTTVSPDGKTLLVLTSGFNREFDATGAIIPPLSTEFVFVFDISHHTAVQKQAIPVPNTLVGITFSPDGKAFYVSGGVDDNVHKYTTSGGVWAESGTPVALGHAGAGNGLFVNVPGFGSAVSAGSAGLAISRDGSKIVVANYENDSISVVDVASFTKSGELDLRPGKIDATQAGVAGGEFPYGVVIKGNKTAYVSSIRDREIDVVNIASAPTLVTRIQVQGNPNKMLLNRSESRLLVATDNSDVVYVIDTKTNQIVDAIKTTAPRDLVPGKKLPIGSSPNSLAFSPDERTLYVTNSGTNSVAVIELDEGCHGQVVGLIPTGWFPNSVSVSRDGKMLYVVNGKSIPGPSTANCGSTSASNTFAPGCPASLQNGSGNQYVWQTTKAGFLTLPTPDRGELARLTEVVARNSGLVHSATPDEAEVMAALHQRIKHVVYIVKENRTYDQILGDIKASNGDANITQFPQAITPNFHAIATQFVNLDNFYCSGEVSMDGWQWSTAARTADINDKTVPVNYGGRGLSYDSEGTTRDVNVAYATNAERHQFNPINPLDPDLLPGLRNEVELDGPNGEEGGGYIWNAALRAGKSVRNYGFFEDLTLYSAPAALGGIPLVRDPFSVGLRVAFPATADLLPITDIYFRGFDPAFPDFWRFKEWEREFDANVTNKDLPAFELVRFMEDHTGDFATAIDGVNTPELQQADNDYAVGLLIDKIAHSAYAHDTLIFVLEDDSQDGPDHVDAHRSTGYVAGPFVKQGVVVSTHFSTVNMLRTIEDILGVEHLNLNDGGAHPMAEIFDLHQRHWTYDASPSDILRTSTTLPLPPKPAGASTLPLRPTHNSVWWADHTSGFDFRSEDRIDAPAYNRLLWTGLKGDLPYPSMPAARVASERD